jgi:hypothetical protein
MAQGCSTQPIQFPDPGGVDYQVPSPTCIANSDEGPTGQGGRLRWDETISGGSTHELELFDSDDGGELLWCANTANDKGGSSSPTNCLNAKGSVLCLQQDGNMVIYKPGPGQGTIDCGGNTIIGTDPDVGVAVWSSGTERENVEGQELLVAEEIPLCNPKNGVCRTLHGDRAGILNPLDGYTWASLGYAD